MQKTIQRKYARLIARVGANIQKGQAVRLYINADQYEFAEIMVDECYKAGAARRAANDHGGLVFGRHRKPIDFGLDGVFMLCRDGCIHSLTE